MRRLDIETVSAEELRQDIAVEENEENGTLTLAEQAGDILEGILAAAENLAGETQEITISRNGKKYFKIMIRPVSEEKARKLRKQCTNYKKNRKLGVMILLYIIPKLFMRQLSTRRKPGTIKPCGRHWKVPIPL